MEVLFQSVKFEWYETVGLFVRHLVAVFQLLTEALGLVDG